MNRNIGASLLLLLCLKQCFLPSAAETFNAAQKELLNKSFEECSKATNVNMDILRRARNNDFVEDEGLKKYYECMFEHFNWMDDKGTFKTDNVKEFLHLDSDPAKWKDIVEHCFEKVTNNDVALVAYHAVMCFTDKIGGKIIL